MQESASLLIVEDSSVQALRLRKILEKQGWHVAVVANGREALEYLQRARPALVISDIHMPEMNGVDMCRTMKQDAALRSIPVLLLTTISDNEDLFLLLNACADDYLAKPYSTEDLFAAIDALVSNASGRPADQGITEPVSVTVSGTVYEVTAGRLPTLRLLLSMYQQGIEQNRLLMEYQREVRELRQQVHDLTLPKAA